MNLSSMEKTLAQAPFILTEGAVIERLRREYNVSLDPHILNAALIYTDEGKSLLASIYREYLDIGREHDLPMFIFTPTWRANGERIWLAGLRDRDVNGDCVGFVYEILKAYGTYARKVYVGGLMGCKGDAYDPAEALSEEDASVFHPFQAEALACAGVDFLAAVALPAVSEALGVARSMADTGCPYLLSFVVRPEGTLLDGTLLGDAICMVDEKVSPRPVGYLVNCVHPSVFRKALLHGRNAAPSVRKRLLGLQANTSSKSPEELDGSLELDTEPPELFAASMASLHQELGMKVLGGCCGTDSRHIRALAEKIA